MTAAERIRITANDILFDELPEFESWEKQRPVLVELSTTYVVWVDADADIERLRSRSDWYEDCHSENAVAWGQSVDEPEYGSDWLDVYDQQGESEEPRDQIQGPDWRCPEPRCHAWHPANASWERHHNPFCPTLAELPAGAS